MHRHRLASFAVLCLLALAAVLLSGCGAQPEVEVAQAAARTADAGSSRLSAKVTIDRGGIAGGKMELRGEGAIDAAARPGRLTLEQPSLPMSGGPGLSAEDLRLEEIFAGSRVYLRGKLFDRILPKGREWVEIDLKRLGKGQGLDLPGLSQISSSDPRQPVDLLRATSDDVEELGRETVRGVPTTHY